MLNLNAYEHIQPKLASQNSSQLSNLRFLQNVFGQVMRPLTSHLKRHSSRKNEICGTLLEKYGQTHQ